MSDHEYDLFEKASDETVIWQCSVRGALAAEEKISLLSLLTDREVFCHLYGDKRSRGAWERKGLLNQFTAPSTTTRGLPLLLVLRLSLGTSPMVSCYS